MAHSSNISEQDGQNGATSVDEVLITDALRQRPQRSPNYEAEARALGELAREMAANPAGVLQKVAELSIELTQADSAGISILEPGGENGIFRWHAAAGKFAGNLNGTIPRDAGPCGTVLARDDVLLFNEADRFFPALRGMEPRAYENLLVPWHANGEPIGTLWAISHDPQHQFDAEDARLLEQLSRFASAAWQIVCAAHNAENRVRQHSLELTRSHEAHRRSENLNAAMQQQDEERKKVETALREAQERLQKALSIETVGVRFFRLDGRIIDANEAFVRMSGYSREELLNIPHWKLLTPPEFLDATDHAVQELISRGDTKPYEKELIRKDGSRWWGLFSPKRLSGTGEQAECVEFVLDITQAKRVESEVRLVAQRYRTLFNLVPVAVYATDAQGTIQDFNQNAVELWGRTPVPNAEKFCGSYRILYPDGRPMPHDECPMARVLRGETLEPAELEVIVEQHNGSRHIVMTAPRAIKNERGEIIGAINSLHDITQRKQTENSLRESEDRMRMLADSIPQMIWTNRADGAANYFNRRWYEYTGLSYEESAGLGWQKIVHPDDAAASRDRWQRALQSEKTFDSEYRLRGADGSYRWFIGRNAPLRDSGGRVISWFGSATDIDELKKAGAARRESEERFRLLVDGAKDYAMFLLDLEGTITYWSKGAERLFGWKQEEATGKPGDLIFTPEDRQRGAAEREIEMALREGRAPDRRWHLRKDGSRLWIDGVLTRLESESGEPRGFAKIARDATDQRDAEDELRYARDQLEQRVLERTADLMATNNELERTMVQREQLERELLDISERERRRIGQDLHDVVCQELTATALFLKSAGNKINNPQAAKSLSEAAEIVNRNVAIARDLARGFQPTVLAAGGLPAALRTLCKDANERHGFHCTLKLPRAIRVRDETIALNLFRIAQEAMRNSMTHSGGDEIVICIEREQELIRLVIEDNGKGFRPRKSAKGLGLHIMKYRANALGGTLTVTSRRSGGTKVVCEVPVKK